MMVRGYVTILPHGASSPCRYPAAKFQRSRSGDLRFYYPCSGSLTRLSSVWQPKPRTCITSPMRCHVFKRVSHAPCA